MPSPWPKRTAAEAWAAAERGAEARTQELARLRASDAYTDYFHPHHKAVVARVNEIFAERAEEA